MSLENTEESYSRTYTFLLITGIILISFNLRPAITSVGPLIDIIRVDLSLSHGSAGLITSLPLIAFAIMSPFAARIGNRLSYEGAMILGLIILLFGIMVRSISLVLLLFVGTFFIGLGIAILNVLLPGIIKDKFPLKIGIMTSMYSTAMGIIAATATGVSIPLSENIGLGWQKTLLIWGIPALFGIIIWSVLYFKNKQQFDRQALKYVQVKVKGKQIWRSKLAWQIAAFMGLQSFLFYVTITWLPVILHDNGMSQQTAGWILSFTQFIGLPASFFVPVIAEKLKSIAPLVIGIILSFFIGYGGLLITNSLAIIIICGALIGLALSGVFALALTLLAIRTRTASDAADLSGMAQSVGYVLAAIGPICIGALFDVFGNWNIPVITIMVASLILLVVGLLISKERYVYDK